ncbi:MAG: nuoC [Ilumatobacteraceae bacterium]|nr:nuoC [Ilumatobacteraceae bacterium]
MSETHRAGDPGASSPDPTDPVAPDAHIHGIPVVEVRGQDVAFPDRSELVDLVRKLRADGYIQCLTVTGVDYLASPQTGLPPTIRPERFEVVVILVSHLARRRMRLRVQVPEHDPVVPTLYEVHPGTEAAEREVFDMFGIRFDGHPDLTRILMPEDWEGHPLRKDFGVGQVPVQFKDAPNR